MSRPALVCTRFFVPRYIAGKKEEVRGCNGVATKGCVCFLFCVWLDFICVAVGFVVHGLDRSVILRMYISKLFVPTHEMITTRISFLFRAFRADGRTWLIYMNYYLMDGGVQVCCNTVGAHEYDLEIVIVELSPSEVRLLLFCHPFISTSLREST